MVDFYVSPYTLPAGVVGRIVGGIFGGSSGPRGPSYQDAGYTGPPPTRSQFESGIEYREARADWLAANRSPGPNLPSTGISPGSAPPLLTTSQAAAQLLAPPRLIAPRQVDPDRVGQSIPLALYVDPFSLVAQNLPVPTEPRRGSGVDPLERERRGARARQRQADRMARAAERLLRRRGLLKIARRVGGGLGGVIIGGAVEEMAPGTLTPQQVLEAEQRKIEADLEQLQGVTVNRTRLPEPAAAPVERVGPPAPGARRGAGTSARSPGPTSSSTTPAPITSGIFRRLPWAQILTGALFSGGSTRVNVAPQINVAPSSLTAVEPAAVPSSFGPPIILGTGSSTATCECPPKKKRKPLKKCIEWAQIEWRSGRYKGKPAGRKCVRREQ